MSARSSAFYTGVVTHARFRPATHRMRYRIFMMLLDLDDKDSLAGAAAYSRSIRIEGMGRGAKPREETLEIRSLNNARGVRGRKGKAADLGFKPTRITRVE